MQYAKSLIMLGHAHVSLIIMEIHMWLAGLNAWWTVNVQWVKLASTTNAVILVPVSVVPMLFVMSSIIHQIVSATMVSEEILSSLAVVFLRVRNAKSWTFKYLIEPFFIDLVREEPIVDPCQPSPCGPNSQCRKVNNVAVCSCIKSYIGSPPNCKPECVVSADCNLDKSCTSYKCRDPCPGTCGINARCQVVNHSPICSCKNGFVGDPFIRCVPEESKLSLHWKREFLIHVDPS